MTPSPADSKIMKEDKFLVFNMKYINQLSPTAKGQLSSVLEELVLLFPKAANNRYICCNQDEPYAEAVWQFILEGERKKRPAPREAPAQP